MSLRKEAPILEDEVLETGHSADYEEENTIGSPGRRWVSDTLFRSGCGLRAFSTNVANSMDRTHYDTYLAR